MILFFIFVFICMFYNELVFLLQTEKEKESRKIKLGHPRWPNVVVKMAPVCSTGIVWIGTVLVGKKKSL